MGGEGQPQTQAMIFARHVLNNVALQEAVSAPRWLPGRTWGSTNTNLHIEQRFDPALYDAPCLAGHDVEQVGDRKLWGTPGLSSGIQEVLRIAASAAIRL